MELLPIAFLAGVLTVLSPCALPLLPVVLAGSTVEFSRRASFLITGSLAVSVVLFTLLIKATTVLLGVPGAAWLIVSGALVAFVGGTLAFPAAWEWLSGRLRFHAAAGTLAHRSGRTIPAGTGRRPAHHWTVDCIRAGAENRSLADRPRPAGKRSP